MKTSNPKLTVLEVLLAELSPISGKTVLDIGCGKGRLRGPLEKAGACWRGLDPASAITDFPIDIAPAEAMPYANNSFGAAICVNALHHVPIAAMDAALCEAARVVYPAARLVVIEPKTAGALSQVIAVVDDETQIRTAAQDAMDRSRALKQINAYDYERIERYTGFDAFAQSLIAVDPDRKDLVKARYEDLRHSFEAMAKRVRGELTLSQPMSVRVFQPL